MIILKHVTSLAAALQILRSRRFQPAMEDPRAADGGMNTFLPHQFTENARQQATSGNAVMTFEWHGPVVRRSLPPYPRNEVSEDANWRGVVGAGTSNFLLLVAIDTVESWADQVSEAPPWYCITKLARRRWREQAGEYDRNNAQRSLKYKPPIWVCWKPTGRL